MGWEILYYSDEVEQAILRLPPGLLARYLRLTDLMEEVGPNLGMPTYGLWVRASSNFV